MTTSITKRVKRLTEGLYRNGGQPRKLVVTLYPGDTIGIREQGRRKEEFISIASVHQYAIRCRVSVERMDKAKARIKRKAGR